MNQTERVVEDAFKMGHLGMSELAEKPTLRHVQHLHRRPDAKEMTCR